MCEFFAHYALTVLSGCTVALFAYWLHNKDNGKKIGDCSHTIKKPPHCSRVRGFGVVLNVRVFMTLL
ncbi:type I toxin-antitoxin system Fst family toxin [Staphylococcus delphini]|uniref:type I toxin-antitoxin system Fst family toxin n=1 Tax=Staphylococcus delphini TaxID=53344 RepID=UPI003743D049